MTNLALNIEEAWVAKWNDLADFEIIPVLSSIQAKQKY